MNTSEHQSFRPVNAGPPETPPFFAARPINGGTWEIARPKTGRWLYEPKYNGWRALVHVPTGTMFNRHGKRLTIASEFAKALEILRQYSFEWLDCEALERRHGIGRGTLVVLDAPCLDMGYEQRRDELEREIFCWNFAAGRMGEDTVYLTTCCAQPDTLWGLLKQANGVLFCEFYEGMVAKRADSRYPKARTSSEDTTLWMKHRWVF